MRIFSIYKVKIWIETIYKVCLKVDSYWLGGGLNDLYVWWDASIKLIFYSYIKKKGQNLILYKKKLKFCPNLIF